MQPTSPPNDGRRTFLKWATNGIGAIFAVVLGAPAIAYLFDPRNRPLPSSDLRAVAGVKLSEVGNDPVQGVLRDVRHDAWTRSIRPMLGRVWIHRLKPGKTKDCYVVLSTTCPHLGCSVNANANQAADPDCLSLPRRSLHGRRSRLAVNPGPPPPGWTSSTSR